MPYRWLVHEGPSSRLVSIGEDAGRAALLVDGVVQSISPEDGLSTGGYWAAMVPSLRPRRALILGLGGGTLARLLQARWGETLDIVGVDDDVAIVETALAAGWLGGPSLQVVYADAFHYVHTARQRFDYVAIDLFRGERLIGRALSRPFLRQVRDILEPPGLLAVNMFSDRYASKRIDRLSDLFDIIDKEPVGGNVVVHARARRMKAKNATMRR
jgi:spermidine synthase